jgi:short-subunit dehydrogenase
MILPPAVRTVVITGASAGLGAGLADCYAAPGVTLGLVARNAARLEAVAAACRARGATVRTALIDVTDAPALAGFISELEAVAPIDLLIANAGVFTGHGPNRRMEDPADVVWQMRTNMEGVAATIGAVLPGMRARKAGRLAIVASLAALQPLADAPGYSASKAAAASYGEALREFLIEDGVAVTIVYPGHVATEQTEHQVGGLHMVWPVEKAARVIKRGLDRGAAQIVFPKVLYALILLGRLVPWRVRALFGRDFRFHVKR